MKVRLINDEWQINRVAENVTGGPINVPVWDGKSLCWYEISQRYGPAFGAIIFEMTDEQDADGLPVFR